ncbi:bifunctional cytidylate kinase ribosomal protein s1 [Paraburkholderia caribensis MBA4]|uniref:Bifunctional cytidylate kinase ribosomal protein s1 n=1 Tax=Paraburkholderia caribensis MBA4 TaxID=1323664 RepID=A0A0P0RJX8_9BURK|nr:bifunctional cytidylate kinase ribosomal protein s1 [Paraburkholderia caribensis MBA4]
MNVFARRFSACLLHAPLAPHRKTLLLACRRPKQTGTPPSLSSRIPRLKPDHGRFTADAVPGFVTPLTSRTSNHTLVKTPIRALGYAQSLAGQDFHPCAPGLPRS